MHGYPGLPEQDPQATSSGAASATNQQQNSTLQYTGHTAGLNQEVVDAVNRLSAQNWGMSITAATQALCNLNMQVALHILDNIGNQAGTDNSEQHSNAIRHARSQLRTDCGPQLRLEP